MKDLASSTLKIEEVYDPEKTYNVCTAGEAANLYSSALPFRLLNSIFGIQEGEKTVVSQPDACRKLGSYLKEENLPLLKEYVKTCLYSDPVSYTHLDVYKRQTIPSHLLIQDSPTQARASTYITTAYTNSMMWRAL